MRFRIFQVRLTLFLPVAPPSSTWVIFAQNLNASTLTVNGNGNTINAGGSLTLMFGQSTYIFTDGANYFTQPPVSCGYGTTCTFSSAGISVAVDTAVVAPGARKLIGYEAGSENAATALGTADLNNHSIVINDNTTKTLTEASCITDTGSQTVSVKIRTTFLFTITCVPYTSYSRTSTDGTTGYIIAANMVSAGGTLIVPAGAQLDLSGTSNTTTKDLKLTGWAQ